VEQVQHKADPLILVALAVLLVQVAQMDQVTHLRLHHLKVITAVLHQALKHVPAAVVVVDLLELEETALQNLLQVMAVRVLLIHIQAAR
jgi:outer membrane receptor for ferrienterochelin and colicin